MSRLARSLLSLAASVACTLPLTRAADEKEPAKITNENVFVRKGEPTAAAAASGEAYEFAGVSTIGKKNLINIYDRGAKKGRWIAEGETVEGIAVVKFDAVKEQVVARIHGAEKILPLRKASTLPAGGAPVSVNAAPGAFVQPIQPPGFIMTAPTNGGNPQPGTLVPAPVAPPQPPPPAKGTVAYQEQEARMLVSDLLEIGMAQRKAYEEAQKKAATQGSPPAAPDTK